MNKNAKYCSKYRNENINKIRQKYKERKKFEREYVKYCDKEKYKEKREKSDRERDSLRRESWNRYINLHQHQPENKLKL